MIIWKKEQTASLELAIADLAWSDGHHLAGCADTRLSEMRYEELLPGDTEHTLAMTRKTRLDILGEPLKKQLQVVSVNPERKIVCWEFVFMVFSAALCLS